jgi:hypothetical protein
VQYAEQTQPWCLAAEFVENTAGSMLALGGFGQRRAMLRTRDPRECGRGE